jgi:hypothetical protein
MCNMRVKLHDTKVRKFLSFAGEQAEAIRLHGERRGCHSFGEAVRDLVRIALDSLGKATEQDQRNSREVSHGKDRQG